MLDGTEDAGNSALKRARRSIDDPLAGIDRDRTPPSSKAERDLVGRFAAAFENDDIDGIVALLTDDAKLTMRRQRLPPHTHPSERPASVWELPQRQTRTLGHHGISGIARFLDNSVFPYFGLPRTLRE